MRFFPIKTTVLCIILIPVLYILTLTGCRVVLEKQYLYKIENIFIGNTNILLNGTISIEDQIAKNIHHFLSSDFLVRKMSLKLDIRVITKNGKIIFPTYAGPDFLPDDQNMAYDARVVANKNFALLNEELKVKLILHLDHGSKIANLILTAYSAVSFFIFFLFYKIGSRKAEEYRREQKELIKNLKEDEIRHEKIVKDLSKERQLLFENIRVLNKKYQDDKNKAKVNEDEMFNEIINLEEQLNTYIELKKNKDDEITELKSAIEKYERRKSGKSKRNEFDFISKRFNTLYKNIAISRKALNGFMNLNEDQQIKAEETIHQLDRNPETVIVKRKVFSGKKHKNTCFEVLFAYNGRLYFKRQANHSEVVVIGTKNSQQRDMDFLQGL